MSHTLEQFRARHALQFVRNYKTNNPDSDYQAKLRTLIHNAPIQILQNGLGQALAFQLADNENKTGTDRLPSGHLYDCIQGWLSDRKHPPKIYDPDDELIQQLVEGDRTHYMRAQAETLKLFNWLKKFADAWLSDGAN